MFIPQKETTQYQNESKTVRNTVTFIYREGSAEGSLFFNKNISTITQWKIKGSRDRFSDIFKMQIK